MLIFYYQQLEFLTKTHQTNFLHITKTHQILHKYLIFKYLNPK